MSAYAARLKTEMRPLLDELRELNELDEQTTEHKARIDTIVVELGAKKAEYDKALEREQKALEAENSFNSLSEPITPARARGGMAVAATSAEPEIKAISDYLVESREFKNPRNGFYNVQEPVPTAAFYPFLETKAPFIPGGLTQAHGNVRIISPVEVGMKFPLLSFLNTVPWNDLVVPYLPLTFTNNAAEQTWGAPKQESTNSGTIATVMMTTIAHWKDVPRQVLRYIPGLRAVIDSELRTGVLSRAQQRILAGTGAGTPAQMLGILGQVSQVATAATLVSQIFEAIGIVETNGGTVDAILMNPGDYAALLNLQYVNNIFNPLLQGERFGQYRIIRLSAIATETAVVGDFSSSTTVFVGEEANVQATEALGMKSNVVTIRGEMDAVVLVERPWLIVKCDAPLEEAVVP